MLRSMFTVGGFTLLSRLLGFLRDMVIARFLGTGMVADAFFAAFRFPNMFRRIFGEGAFNAAFVPIFGRTLEEEGKGQAMLFASRTFTILALVLGIGTLAAIPAMPWLMSAVVPGFKASADSQNAAPGADGRFVFEANVKGAKAVYFVLDGTGSAPAEATLSAEKPTGFIGSVGHFLGGESEAVSPVDLFSLAEGGAPVLAAGDPVKIALPKGHKFTVLKGAASIPDGARLRVYRNHPDTFPLTATLTAITFSYLLCMALAAHLSGVLNTNRIFGMPAAAPVFLNVVFLIGLLAAVPALGVSKDPVACGHVAAWCVCVAGFIQLGALWLTAWRKSLPVRFARPRLSPRIKKLFKLMGPGIASAGVQQINLLVGGIIASFQAGAVSYLYYSDRVYQLPLGMIGIALGVVLLPEVTRRLRGGDEIGAKRSITQGIEIALVITMPAAIALLVIPDAIIAALFQRGAEFDAESTRQTSLALAGFAAGLPGYVLIKVLQPGYYANENTKAPMVMAGITVAVNIVVSLLLFPKLRHLGLAIGTSVAAWVNVLLLARGLRGFLHIPAETWSRIARIAAAAALMGVAVWAAHRFALGGFFQGEMPRGFSLARELPRAAATAALVLGGMAIYFAAAIALGATSIAQLKAMLRRGRPKG